MDTQQIDEKAVFNAARRIADAAARDDYLSQACGDDNPAIQRIRELLRIHEQEQSFLESPAAGLAATVDSRPIAERPGTIIGPYKLLQQIGEGGMGVVFMAEQSEPIHRTVALKIIKPGMDTRQVIARFEAERQAVAMMDHPNIAKVFDAGATESGRPYFVMELVKGVPITRYCDEKHLPLRARLELFVQVCQAVQHAHQKGIIHRDIKPTNVLVAEYDHHATPKMIDFGVAKATAQRLTERTMFTEFGQVLGTMEYMSPEQSKFNQLDIDTRSDIYSLGVLLYELLTGSTPFEGKRLHEAAFDEMLRIIREEEPPKPSTRVSSIDTLPSVAVNRHTEPARLSKDVRGDLDWIVMKALEKDRNRRYETASGFAADIERHLHDEPVQAGPPATTYRFRKFARRNKGPVAAIAGIVLSLAIGLLLTTIGFMQASRERAVARSNESIARNEAVKATAISALLREMLDSANPDIAASGSEYTVRQMLDEFSTHLGDQLKDQPEAEAAIRASIGNAYWRIGLNPDAEPHLKRALALRRQVLNADHPDLTQSLVDYAMNVCDLGDGVAAESLANEALAIYRRRGAKGVEVLRAFFALQLAFERQQSWAKERSAGEDALAFARDAGHKEHPDLANILHSLARALSKSGENAEAEAVARSALAMHRRTHGNEHPETGWALNLLGEIFAAQGNHAEAEPQFREALTILRRCYPDSHHTVSGVMETLRETLRAKGDASAIEALATLKLAEADKRLAMNREDPEVWLARGRVYFEMNDYDKAALDADTAVTLSAGLSTESALGLANFCSQLAGGQRDNKQPEQAEHSYRQAISVRESIGGKAPPEIRLAQANDYNDLAFVLVGATRLPEAERAVRTALELKQTLVNDFPDNRDYRIHLAHSYLGLGHIAKDSGRTSDAVQSYGEAASILNKLVAEPSGTQQFERWLRDTLSQLGDAWLKVNRSDDAKQAHQKALGRMSMLAAEFPDNPDYQLELANFLRDAGDLDGAVAQFSKILDKHPNRADAWTGRAFTYLHLQQWDSAVADYSEAIELAPEVHTNWFHRGHLDLRLAQWDKAAADFTKVVEGWPNEAEGWFLRALAYAQLNQPEKAITDLRQAFAKGFTDVERVKNDSKLDPLRANDEFKMLVADVESRFRPALNTIEGAEFLRNTGEVDEAIKVCAEILSREPDNDAAWRERANCYLRKGAYAKAAEDFTQVIKLKPADAWAWHERGYCYLMLGQHNRAIVDHSKSIELQDHDWGQRLRRGHSYLALGELQKAQDDYSRAIELNPAGWETWYARARLYAQQQELEKARSDLASLLKLSIDPGAQNAIAWRLATDPDPSWRDPKLAVELAERAIAAQPGDGMIWNTVGAARYRNGQWNEAIAAFEKSMELRGGGDSNDWFFLAMCHWQLGNKQAARKWYDQAVVWMDKNQPSNGQLRGFRTEAEELLKITGEKPTTEPPVDVK